MGDEGLAEGVSLVPGTGRHCPLPEFLCKLLAIRKERGNCLPQTVFFGMKVVVSLPFPFSRSTRLRRCGGTVDHQKWRG